MLSRHYSTSRLILLLTGTVLQFDLSAQATTPELDADHDSRRPNSVDEDVYIQYDTTPYAVGQTGGAVMTNGCGVTVNVSTIIDQWYTLRFNVNLFGIDGTNANRLGPKDDLFLEIDLGTNAATVAGKRTNCVACNTQLNSCLAKSMGHCTVMTEAQVNATGFTQRAGLQFRACA